jgi:hypothetical protein
MHTVIYITLFDTVLLLVCIKARPHPLPARVTANDRNGHREFVRTLGSNAVWLDYFAVRGVAA